MRRLVVSAPGKLVLTGEYAVLFGAPAMSAAVDRRAVVTISEAPAERETGEVLISTLGYENGLYRFRPDGDSLSWDESQRALSLFALSWLSCRMGSTTGLAIELDTSSFSDGERKLGLGSSAALVSALVAALIEWAGKPEDAAEVAQQTHRWLQRFRGSGVDVATSVAGGLVSFRRLDHTAVEVATVGWPEGLEAAVLWSGTPVSTPSKLAVLEERGRLGIVDTLVAAAEQAADAWGSGEAGTALDATARFTEVLDSFSAAYGLEVFAAGHRALRELADERGLVYKPCGAGGGDAGVVLGTSPGAVEDFVDRAGHEGYVPLPVALGGRSEVKGLTVEWTQG